MIIIKLEGQNSDLRFVDEKLQIDLDVNGEFTTGVDMEIHLPGVNKVTYDADVDMFLLS